MILCSVFYLWMYESSKYFCILLFHIFRFILSKKDFAGFKKMMLKVSIINKKPIKINSVIFKDELMSSTLFNPN